MIKLIVGLGNPGDRYQKTRHNAGFWLLDDLSNASFREEKKFQGEYAKVSITCDAPAHLLKPLTFMNGSGRAVSAISRFYNIHPEEILVIHDELDLPAGAIKLKQGGGHGGHNGLRDIIAALGSRDFYRLRIGIGHPGERSEVINYVLNAPSKQEKQQIDEAISRGIHILPTLFTLGAEKAMHQLHSS